MALLCSLRRAGVSLGGKPVLREIDLDLEPGQVLGITGPNGSGKTTLIRVLATLVRIDRGEGRVLDADLATDQIYGVRDGIGMMGHLPAAITELTLAENLEHIARLAGIDPGRVTRALEVVGLANAATMRAGSASHGMIRRLEVARLLLTRPRLLLLDEATHGLDPPALQLIDSLRARTVELGGGVVIVSHDQDRLGRFADRIVHLESGSMVAGP